MRRNSRAESKAFSVGLLLFLSIALASGPFHMQGVYDFDGDGKKESIVQNFTSGPTLSLLEFSPRGASQLIWSWDMNHSGIIMDFEVMDVNHDTFNDLVVISNRLPGEVIQPWLYVFTGNEAGLAENPLKLYPSELGLASVRPTTISALDTQDGKIIVALGSPIRKTAVFSLDINESTINIDNINYVGTDLIVNGYGKLASSVYRHKNQNYIIQLSLENNTIKAGVFNGNDLSEISSDVLVSDARGRLQSSSLSFFSKEIAKEDGLLLPFDSGDVERISFDGKNLELSPSSYSGKNLFTVTDPNKRYKKWSQEKLYPPSGPTLLDFIQKAKKEVIQNKPLPINQVPTVSTEMTADLLVTSAGGENVKIIEADLIPENPILPPDEKDKVPGVDDGVSAFSEAVKDTIAKQSSPDTTVSIELETEFVPIDLYYAQVMTPVGKTPKRFVFDGESPFGVGVNQMPLIGDPTHIQHSISANLAHLNRGSVYDYAYSIRNARVDSITTISMVHDMQTNVVFLSISPLKDSLSQSYQPVSFDPTLFEFPDYFFEGFPSSLGMDFTDQLIRFSFDGDSTSAPETHGIYLSATSPSNPAQSLAVFLDQGELQAIRGEVKVRENGSKKITTEFDLVGQVEPAVMFSRLIEEIFPDSLKVRLLQGGTFEEPLWRSSGQFPEILMKKRLPTELKEQSNPIVPIKAVQSHIPEKDSLKVEPPTGPKPAEMLSGEEALDEPALPPEQSPADNVEDEPKNQIETIESEVMDSTSQKPTPN